MGMSCLSPERISRASRDSGPGRPIPTPTPCFRSYIHTYLVLVGGVFGAMQVD